MRRRTEALPAASKQTSPRSDAPALDDVLNGDASAWRRFVAYYHPQLRAVVQHATEETELFSDADVDDILGDFWLAVVADDRRMLRAFKPKRGAELITWLTFHVAHIAGEHVRRKGHEPAFIPFDEACHGAVPMTASIDDAIRAVVHDAITRELRQAPAPVKPTSTVISSEYVSAVQAAEIAGVRPATVREWVSQGRLQSHRAGRLVRIRTDDLHHFLTGNRDRRNVVDIETRRRRALERLR